MENEFHYAKEGPDKEHMGDSLRYLGRRLLELVDELGARISSKEWKKQNIQFMNNIKRTTSENNNDVEESVTATIKLGS